MKTIFVTGGVCSSLGKGIAATSLGNILESRGLNICMVKIDPYINVDAGTMSPYQHGEVYVTDDGSETDLDLGNYARFTSSRLGKSNSITTGQVYQAVIKQEREGRYLGRTVQVIPHITDEIKRRIYQVGNHENIDICIVEIGGTVGDIESVPFLETARQFVHDEGRENTLFVHLTLIPEVIGGELKTKPTQHSVKELREIGIQPDILLCRAPNELTDDMIRKISLFTNVAENAVISAHDVNTTIYEIPLIYNKQRLDNIVVEKLGIECPEADMSKWKEVVDIYINAKKSVKIGIIGKYINLHDTYKSISEALIHGGIANGVKTEIIKIDSEELESEESLEKAFMGVHGILIPGGFGQRGIEGMIMSAAYARKYKIPYFGICLGMQVAVIEFARNVLKLSDAHSTEFSPETKHPVISLLSEQINVKDYGGTMRLGASETHLLAGTQIRKIYNQTIISERHRHRYEVSNKYRNSIAKEGLILCGVTPDDTLVESIQMPDHPWGIGVQYHPEFKSRPDSPHPLFTSFIEASIEYGK